MIINFGSCHLNSEEQFMKVTSNLNVTLQKKVMNQKAHQYCDKIGHETQQLAAMRKLLWKFTIKSASIDKMEAEIKKRNIHGQCVKYLD